MYTVSKFRRKHKIRQSPTDVLPVYRSELQLQTYIHCGIPQEFSMRTSSSIANCTSLNRT